VPRKRFPLHAYAEWVAGEAIRKTPAVCVQAWIDDWGPVLEGLIAASSKYELVSLIGARIEFLGGLHRGTETDTNCEDFVAYCNDFLVPVQPRYAALHRMTDRPPGNGSDFFTMFRNKSLHGMTPAATAFVGDLDVIAWWVGYAPHVPDSGHLLVDDSGSLHVNCKLLRDELLASMSRFMDHLRSGTTRGFQRALWLRYKPRHMPTPAWAAAGIELGVPV